MPHRFPLGALVTLNQTRGPIPARVTARHADGTYDIALVAGQWAFKIGGYPCGIPDTDAWLSHREHRVPGDDVFDAAQQLGPKPPGA